MRHFSSSHSSPGRHNHILGRSLGVPQSREARATVAPLARSLAAHRASYENPGERRNIYFHILRGCGSSAGAVAVAVLELLHFVEKLIDLVFEHPKLPFAIGGGRLLVLRGTVIG
ncbi:MAG: hypothetical protein JWL69_3391 [Phycisphaerales bacterium]|nr:hypothetical protein [Phycisphaerales bacterium]